MSVNPAELKAVSDLNAKDKLSLEIRKKINRGKIDLKEEL